MLSYFTKTGSNSSKAYFAPKLNFSKAYDYVTFGSFFFLKFQGVHVKVGFHHSFVLLIMKFLFHTPVNGQQSISRTVTIGFLFFVRKFSIMLQKVE